MALVNAHGPLQKWEYDLTFVSLCACVSSAAETDVETQILVKAMDLAEEVIHKSLCTNKQTSYRASHLLYTVHVATLQTQLCAIQQ